MLLCPQEDGPSMEMSLLRGATAVRMQWLVTNCIVFTSRIALHQVSLHREDSVICLDFGQWTNCRDSTVVLFTMSSVLMAAIWHSTAAECTISALATMIFHTDQVQIDNLHGAAIKLSCNWPRFA